MKHRGGRHRDAVPTAVVTGFRLRFTLACGLPSPGFRLRFTLACGLPPFQGFFAVR
ncbi:MAG: hypothetical protein IJ160_03055 [Muribaculaceae bacterium]|nr:hypothetical protein [Muribaculaceae bacterium]